MRKSANLCIALLMVGWLAACGGGDDPADTGSGGTTTKDTATGGENDATAVDSGPKIAVQSTDLNVTIQVQTQSIDLSGTVFYPADCQAATPCPLVIVVGDRDSNAYPKLEGPAEKLAARTRTVVVVFNLPGMGKGALKSGGANDYGGINHVTAVKEIMKLLSKRAYVDGKRTGFLSLGTGLIPTARALKLHGANALKGVHFLVDVEGPTDRCAISQAPEDKGLGIGPNDGPGATDSACHFNADSPHSAVYPAAKDGNRASIVCSESAWPITETNKNCKSSWWNEGREPYNELKAIHVRYQRIQFKHDHRLPSHFASRHAMQAIASSSARWFTLNNLPPCKALPDEDTCINAGCYLQGPWGNGFAPAPYAGKDRSLISMDALFNDVLPGYLLRIMDEKKAPNCK